MKSTLETYDGHGNILSVEEIEVGDVLSKPPSEIEIRLAALESKTGITAQDKEDAATALVAERSQR